jgi:hypothetical protein
MPIVSAVDVASDLAHPPTITVFSLSSAWLDSIEGIVPDIVDSSYRGSSE